MKLTETDLELFKALSKSSLGKDLVDYLDRVQDYICDSREWEEGDTKESANQAARVIKEKIRNRISPQKQSKPILINEGE